MKYPPNQIHRNEINFKFPENIFHCCNAAVTNHILIKFAFILCLIGLLHIPLRFSINGCGFHFHQRYKNNFVNSNNGLVRHFVSYLATKCDRVLPKFTSIPISIISPCFCKFTKLISEIYLVTVLGFSN